MLQTTASRFNRPGDIGGRVREEGHRAWLDEALHSVVLDALGPDARVALAREEWGRLEDAIRGPVAAVAAAALDRLAVELESVLSLRTPELVRRLRDHRLRAELGYD